MSRSPYSPAPPVSGIAGADGPIRAVAWWDGAPGTAPGRGQAVPDRPGVRLLDQTALPQDERYLVADTVDALVDAIRRLVVRGAPALGAAGALGVALALHQAEREGWDAARRDGEIARIRDARPTAVNLAAAVDAAARHLPAGAPAVLAFAARLVAEDERANRTLSTFGADWILARTGTRPLRVLTHCNTGALATAAWGTALGIVRELHRRGLVDEVRVDETRPLLQGSRLTAWELEREGIPYVVQVDAAAAFAVARGLVDVAVVGADRVTANGDTANKIGTLAVALACRDRGVPFVVAAPWTSVDLETGDGAAIHVEQRPADEVLSVGAPPGARADNPAFDVTPARLIDALVTERGIVEPAADPGAVTGRLARLAP
ncbi:MAG TPA: S-methyl-5-thioribose-1-phosphate isomerase [Kineosporiaceae bacterium]